MDEIVEVREAGMTVDKLCWRYYGDEVTTTPRVLAANPGLAEIGPVLPPGTRVRMPPKPEPKAPALATLWN